MNEITDNESINQSLIYSVGRSIFLACSILVTYKARLQLNF